MPQVYQKQAQIQALAISFIKLQYINITLPVLVEFQKMTYFLVILIHWTTTIFKHTLTPYHTSITLYWPCYTFDSTKGLFGLMGEVGPCLASRESWRYMFSWYACATGIVRATFTSWYVGT